MVSKNEGNGSTAEAVVTEGRMSTVVPGQMTGHGRVLQLTNLDLALKLHYLRMLKNPMFRLMEPYFPACGRIRRSSSGRPVLKCNDGGVRFVEARCGKILGPDLSFSPPVAVQVFHSVQVWGLAVGFSWSHVLGDAVSAARFAGNCFRAINGDPPPQLRQLYKSPARIELPGAPFSAAATPLSVRAVDTVNGCWLPAGEVKMESLSLEISGDQVEVLREKTLARRSFDAIAAVVWRSLARIRERAGSPGRWLLGNDQAVGVMRAAELSPAAADLSELAKLLAGGFSDETPAIEAFAEAESGGLPDLILYGANLSFVDLEDLPVYDVAVRGQRPVFVNFTIEGVGGEGSVLVFRGGGSDGGGRTVNAVLPAARRRR
ncbi:unnamed protein product [Spirodela intermedia]|uniref:Uncharacterized protein n=1 Tax=Spirodela intermedia TaxID=51605 RepID=A0A7I8IYN6_SPIIN|nr:unnamed protein product [Spirodela intermedia]CAA6663084.1 unnamed protein product [Spirodela intermedia]